MKKSAILNQKDPEEEIETFSKPQKKKNNFFNNNINNNHKKADSDGEDYYQDYEEKNH
jgi:hypothetical protein